MSSTPLVDMEALLRESCKEDLDMACGDADPNFFDSQEDDWRGCCDSSCEEFSEEDGDDDYGDEEEEAPNIEQMLWPFKMSWFVDNLQLQ
jgi:hypothetical protein